MKKFYFEADKKQWEKATEPKYMFCPAARTWAIAETEEEARAAALQKLNAKYHGTGTLIDDTNLRLTKTADLPVDWSYGYGDSRSTGTAEDKAALIADNKR